MYTFLCMPSHVPHSAGRRRMPPHDAATRSRAAASTGLPVRLPTPSLPLFGLSRYPQSPGSPGSCSASPVARREHSTSARHSRHRLPTQHIFVPVALEGAQTRSWPAIAAQLRGRHSHAAQLDDRTCASPLRWSHELEKKKSCHTNWKRKKLFSPHLCICAY